MCKEKISNLPNRKQYRLEDYDYSLPGAYFITLCTKNRTNCFWNDVGARIARPLKDTLSNYGIIVKNSIKSIPKHYSSITVDNYVIMPDHIHLLLQIHTDSDGRAMRAPTISTVVNQMKGCVTKQIGFSVWQKLFHDHIVRGEQDYKEIWEYIENNPLNWQEKNILPDFLDKRKKEG